MNSKGIFILLLVGLSLLVFIILKSDKEILKHSPAIISDVNKTKKSVVPTNLQEVTAIPGKNQLSKMKVLSIEDNVNIDNKAELSRHTEMVSEEKKNRSLTESGYHEAHKKTELFSVVDEAHDQIPSNLDFSTYGRPIILSEQKLRNLKENQTVTIPLETPRSLLVKDVVIRSRGVVKIDFSLPNKGPIYRGFITVGRKATYGRIVTPEGSYELEVVNGMGWIVDTRNIDTKEPKDGEDYLIPNT